MEEPGGRAGVIERGLRPYQDGGPNACPAHFRCPRSQAPGGREGVVGIRGQMERPCPKPAGTAARPSPPPVHTPATRHLPHITRGPDPLAHAWDTCSGQVLLSSWELPPWLIPPVYGGTPCLGSARISVYALLTDTPCSQRFCMRSVRLQSES